MVNLSPDTNADADWGSGYRYERDSIKFFSHIHGWQLSGVSVLPVNVEFQGHLGSKIYGSKYSHSKETVKPGYHSVFLEKYGIRAELTSTTRRPKELMVFFNIQVDSPFENLQAWKDGKLLGPVNEFEGSKGGIYLKFNTAKEKKVLMKVGISYVSEEQARLNLQTELPHWDFDKVVNEPAAPGLCSSQGNHATSSGPIWCRCSFKSKTFS